MDQIRIEGMVFYGYHGVFAEEKKLGSRFTVDLELYLDLAPAAASDSVLDTVDYGAAYEVVRTIVEGTPANLIETVAGRICDALFKQFSQLNRIVVEVSKPSAPVPGIFQRVSTRFDRSRTNVED
nr:dihydroneopterin aldolase [Alicyclobacillus ferrooxydans]